MPIYEYDVALSFAGEDRHFVEQVAQELARNNVRVFYDNFEASILWGKDLYTHLDEIYRHKARYCIMFLSQYYANKMWTNHERESAQARAFTENGAYILPVKLDDTMIAGIRPTTGFIDGRTTSPERIAQMICEKLDSPYIQPEIPARPTSRNVPRVRARQNFDMYRELLDVIKYIDDEFSSEIPNLQQEGINVTKIKNTETEKQFRFSCNGQLVYFLNVRLGGFISSDSISFLDGWSEPLLSENSATAYARIEWSQQIQQPIIKLTNFSLLDNVSTSSDLTKEKLFSGLWDKMRSTIESNMS